MRSNGAGIEQIAVRAGDHRVGMLADADSGSLQALVEQGSQLDRPVITVHRALQAQLPGTRARREQVRGAQCKLTPAQVDELEAVLDAGPAACGCADQCWTLALDR